MPKQKGRFNKSTLIREAMEKVKEPIDWDRLLAICTAKLNQVPAEQRAGVEIKRNDLYQTWRNVQKKRSINKTVTPVQRIVPAAPPPDHMESFSMETMLAGKVFLRSCGNSLHRANVVLKFLIDLIEPANKENVDGQQ